jgi:hypothetical protein
MSIAESSQERQGSNWKVLAIHAWLDLRKARANDEHDRLQARAQRMIERLHALGVPADAEEVEYVNGRLMITVDGVRFSALNEDGRTFPVVLGQCPDCGEEVFGESLSSPPDLGRAILEWRPGYSHWDYCRGQGARIPAPRPVTPAEERLLDALTAWWEEKRA